MNREPPASTEQSLKNLSNQWAAAEQRGDIPFLERTLADDFVAIGPRGFMLTREGWIQRIRSGDLKYETLTWDEVNVRTYGDAAIVTGRSTQKLKFQNQPMENDLRATLVLVKHQGVWRLAGIHMSPIAEPPINPPVHQGQEVTSRGGHGKRL